MPCLNSARAGALAGSLAGNSMSAAFTPVAFLASLWPDCCVVVLAGNVPRTVVKVCVSASVRPLSFSAGAFTVVRLGANAAAARDPAKRALLDKKEALEQAIDKLKYEKATVPAEAYKKQLAALLLELARTQEALEK